MYKNEVTVVYIDLKCQGQMSKSLLIHLFIWYISGVWSQIFCFLYYLHDNWWVNV
jgi:hypothetical protein